LRERYDYIILDMPPIGDVSDALISAKFADGVLFVVRQDHGSKIAVHEAIQQFEFVGAKILGVLFNAVADRATRYSNKKYGYGYRKKYYYSQRYNSHKKD
jgi:Mrp family chromosome partitioning ATPase